LQKIGTLGALVFHFHPLFIDLLFFEKEKEK
jgi:hypothetical protein